MSLSSDGSAREPRLLARVALAGVVLVFTVVLTSAYLRLAQAGLGCEDWPSCYEAALHGSAAQSASALVPWMRAVHRLAAAAVGAIVLVVAVLALRRPRRREATVIAVALAALTLFLAVLGRATPGSQLPAVTLGNVLGGMAMLGTFWWLWLGTAAPARAGERRGLALASRFGIGLLAAQIALGTLVSANYAALSCTTLPDCNGAWWPHGATLAAFDPFSPLSSPALDHPARATLHMAHRYGALVVGAYLVFLGAHAYRRRVSRRIGAVILALVLSEMALGALVVWLSFPLALALGHNAMAAFLVLAVMDLTPRARRPAPKA